MSADFLNDRSALDRCAGYVIGNADDVRAGLGDEGGKVGETTQILHSVARRFAVDYRHDGIVALSVKSDADGCVSCCDGRIGDNRERSDCFIGSSLEIPVVVFLGCDFVDLVASSVGIGIV